MSADDPIALLTRASDDASERLEPGGTDDRQPALISWPAVPIELVRAAGLRPVFVRGGTAATPSADANLEDAGFPNRMRQLIEAVCSGRCSQAAPIVLPRTSDPDYKGFLYLREFVRGGVVRRSGPILLFDLLQSTGTEVSAYNAARARGLFAALGAPRRSGRSCGQPFWWSVSRAVSIRSRAVHLLSPRWAKMRKWPSSCAIVNRRRGAAMPSASPSRSSSESIRARAR